MNFRQATKEDLPKCIDLISNAYMPYKMFNMYCEDEKRRHKFVRAINAVSSTVTCKRNELWIAEEDGELIGCIELETPTSKPRTIIDYLLGGGLKVFKAGGIKNSLGFLSMSDKSEELLVNYPEKHWYVLTLTVRIDKEGKGYGSRIIQEFLIPHVAQNGGGLLTLKTDTEENARFYTRNGFELYKFRKMEFNNKPMDNYSFWMRVERKND